MDREIGFFNSLDMDEQGKHISYEQFVKKLANRLQMFRKDLGLTKENMAHKAGIAVFTYLKYENGESNPKTPMNPRIHTLLALAKAFDMSILELLDVDDSQDELYCHMYISDSKIDYSPEEFSQNLGQRIQYLRWKHNLTQEGLAAKAGITTNGYQAIERGVSQTGAPTNPRLKTLIALANAYDLSVVELINFDEQCDQSQNAAAKPQDMAVPLHA